MRGSIFSFIFILCATVMFAQKAKLNRANQAFKNLNYQEAIETYLAVLDKTDNSEAKRNLAECYRKLDNWVDAEYWYGQTVILPDVKPEDVLHYGMALLSNGKLSQAKEQFQKYISLRPDDLRGQLLLKACDQSVIDDIAKRGAVYKVANATKLNTALDDFGPSYFDDGVVFSSERDRGVAIKRQHGWSDRPFVELFFTKATLADQTTMEYNYSSPEKYSNKINSKFHDGPVSFNSDYSEIYFTRNNLVSGKIGTDNQDVVRLKVFSSKRNGKTWSEMQSLPFNSDEYSVAHPAVSADGSKLYFASDMPGGFGGMDLYVSNLENGRWSPPQNLGPVINTEGHEIFPTLSKDKEGTLFFASDGHTGLGGLDIYYTQERGNGFTPVMNMGSPINSNVDDFHLIMNEEKTHGYFSSNREGGAGGDDIYTFTKFAVEGEVYVFDKATSEPIQGAVVNTGSCNLGNLTTGPDGKQKINLPVNSACEFLASKESFQDNTMQVSTRGYKPGDKVLIQIPLERPYNVKVTGVIKDEQTGRPIGSAKVILESDCGQPTQEFMTDNTGYYEFDLRANCCYVVKVQKESYAASKIDQFCTDKEPKAVVVNKVLKNETRPTTPTVPTNPIETGGAIQLEHIYYDFDKSNIRGEAVASLDELAAYLKSHPSLIVEIGSHTDARATNKYNERLSARRAESVVRYLTQKGIGKNRLRSKGYGETAPVNDCFDNVKCDENQHQDNRRTEFRVIGSVNNQETEIRSTRPGNISVDPCKKCPF